MKQFENALMKYCKENQFDIEKVRKSPKCGNNEVLYIQHVDFTKTSKLGLADPSKKPAEVLISLKKNPDGSYNIEHGKSASKYLGIDK